MGRLKAFDEDEVLDRAVDCFWLRGYAATSVRDLAERMGIGGGRPHKAHSGQRAPLPSPLARDPLPAPRARTAPPGRNGAAHEADPAAFAASRDPRVPAPP